MGGTGSGARPDVMPEVTMKRKRSLVLAGVVLAAAVIVPAALYLHAYCQKLARSLLIDQAHFRRIELGMSRAEVEAVLGGPPGDFTTKPVEYSNRPAPPYDFKCDHGRWEFWAGDDAQIEVLFDMQDTVRFGVISTGGAPAYLDLDQYARIWLRRLRP
jgi:hypothetical protein